MKISTLMSILLAAVGMSAAAGECEQFKIVSYNVRHCEGMDGKLDVARIADVLNRQHPRFAALQELDKKTKRSKGIDEPEELGRLTGMHPTFARAIDYGGGEYGVMLLSREKPLSVETMPLPGAEPRVLLLAEFADCWVGCTHLSVAAEKERADSVALIEKALKGRTKPVFLTGDWNSKVDSSVIKGLSRFLKVLSDTDCRTFHGRPYNGPSGTPDDFCIDYIAVDSANAARFRTVERGVVPDRVSSDHAPIFVTLAPASRPPQGVAAEFFLRPGAPEGNGTKNAPFGSFAAAQNAVRKAVSDASLGPGRVIVTILEGRYFIDRKIQFLNKDSGTAEHPVEWRAQTKGATHLSGGVPTPPLQALSDDDPNIARIQPAARPRVRTADLKAAGIGNYGSVSSSAYMELVWDGKFQTLARWPNDGYTGIADAEKTIINPDGTRIRATKFKYSDDHVSSWVAEPDPHGNGFFCYNWAADNIAIGKIDPATKTIAHKGRGSAYGYSKIGFWFGYNLLCELDSPGEYYIDRERGRMYFIPPSDGGSGVLTMADDLVGMLGVTNVSFSGFVFENCRGRALAARACSGIDIVSCTFRNVGMKAVEFHSGHDMRVRGCDISYCGRGGVSLNGGDMNTLTHSGYVVENCHIHHYALQQLTYAPAVSIYGCGSAVRHCTIHDGPHCAVLFSGREHDISWNEVHSVCLESGEIGAFYSGRDWTYCGNRIDANYFHDIYAPRSQPNRAIMLDDGEAGVTMTSNRIERVGEGISLSAIGNVIENNLFTSNFPPITGWQTWSKHEDYTNPRYTHKQLPERLAALPVHEEPWKSKYPYLGMLDDAIRTGRMRHPDTRTIVRRNIYSCGTTNLVSHWRRYPYSPETWLIENNSNDPAKPPVGFAPLPPLSSIGVQNTPERVTWPVVHPVTVKCADLVYRKK